MEKEHPGKTVCMRKDKNGKESDVGRQIPEPLESDKDKTVSGR